jgi:hypothetical protein
VDERNRDRTYFLVTDESGKGYPAMGIPGGHLGRAAGFPGDAAEAFREADRVRGAAGVHRRRPLRRRPYAANLFLSKGSRRAAAVGMRSRPLLPRANPTALMLARSASTSCGL